MREGDALSLPKGWKEVKIEDLGTIGRGKSKHRPRNADFLFGDKYPFVQTADVKDAEYKIYNYSQMYSEAGLAQSKLWPKGTLCITIAANIADAAILGIDACFPDSVVGFIPDDTKSDVRFVKYLFDLLQVRIKKISQGAAQDNLSLEKIRTLNFQVPPLETQKKIASILSGYDDLIENNLKRIRILEEMAQQTFVSFTQSDNQKLWKSVPLETIIDFHIGGGWGEEEQNEEFSEAGYVIRGTDIDPLKVGNFSKVPFRFHKKSNIKSRELKRGDIVFEVSGGSSNEGVAKTLLITDILLNVFDEKVICASFCKLLRPVNENDSYYLFYFLNYLREVKLTEIYEKRSASNIVNYNWEAFLKYQKILIPTEKELLDFNRKIIPLKTAVINLGIQNQRLREARDILLPRLMMGMIGV